MCTHPAARILYPLLLALPGVTLALLTLRPVQAAPTISPLRANITVTTTIQAALDAAAPGDTVIVPAGLYTESLTLSKAISLTGVSSATTIIHAIPNQRVLTITGATIDNSVVISGLMLTGGRATGGSGGLSCPTLCGGGILVNNNAHPLLQNLIITNNQADYSGGGIEAEASSPLTLTNVKVISNNAGFGGGGGLYILSTLTLTNTDFISNTSLGFGGGAFATRTVVLVGGRFERNAARYGGGLYTNDALTLINTEFISNTAIFQGGGVGAQGATKLTDGYFQNNISGESGGGLAGNTLMLTNTIFINNSTSNSSGFGGGGAVAFNSATVTSGRFENNHCITTQCFGGGLYVSNTLTLTGTTFLSNSANVGGGLYANSTMTLTNASFINNTSGGGGGVHAHRTARLTDSRFEGNSSTGTGGGLFAAEALTLINTSFFSNTAADWAGGALGLGSTEIIGGRFQRNIADYGAALALDNTFALTSTQFLENAADKGGGIYHTDQEPIPGTTPNGHIVNVLFAGNTANPGAALYFDAPGRVEIFHTTIAAPGSNPGVAVTVLSGTVGITNTIIASHTTGISQAAGTVNEDYNLFFNVPTTGAGIVIHGSHSLTGDPHFVAPAGDDYHLGADSAALNVAFPSLVSTDFEGDSRPLGPGSDIGFDEAKATSPNPTLYLPVILKNW